MAMQIIEVGMSGKEAAKAINDNFASISPEISQQISAVEARVEAKKADKTALAAEETRAKAAEKALENTIKTNKEATDADIATLGSKQSELDAKIGVVEDHVTITDKSFSYFVYGDFKAGDIVKVKVSSSDATIKDNKVSIYDSVGAAGEVGLNSSDYLTFVFLNDSEYFRLFKNINSFTSVGTLDISIRCNIVERLRIVEELAQTNNSELSGLSKNIKQSSEESDESSITINDNDGTFIAKIDGSGIHVKDIFIQETESEKGESVRNLFGDNKEYMDEVIASKKLFKTDGDVVFNANTHLFSLAHVTDIHTDRVRYEYFLDIISKKEIDDAICTGDFVVNNTASEWQTIFEGNPNDGVIKVVGNHDAQAGMTDAQIAQYMGVGSLYYYKDIITYQGTIRLIVLNQFDVNGLSGAEKSATFHYSQAQIDWFVNTLKDAQSSGNQVLVAMHTPESRPATNNSGFHQRYFALESVFRNYLCKGTPIEDIINAFKRGEAINKTWEYKDTSNTITVNTSFEQGTFIAYLAGHVHADLHGVSSKYNDQLYLCETCGCLKVGTKDYANRYSDLHRVEGDASENAFNVYSFDLNQKVIKVVRIGARINDLLEDRKCTVFNY